ncbi:MAG: hypothetical protein IJX37_09430 [Oscillospiraceae bacterium]|nr:hypothetical protein [Oscillospiraceae bacterium]
MKNKTKKYIYPFVFSAAFLSLYFAFVLIITQFIDFPYGSYAPAAWAVLFTFAWLIVALPIYCIRYSKIIIDEKLKFLFSIYNSLLIIVSHILPFNVWGEWRTLTHFVLWVLFWNILLLVFRLISRKYEEKHTENEPKE